MAGSVRALELWDGVVHRPGDVTSAHEVDPEMRRCHVRGLAPPVSTVSMGVMPPTLFASLDFVYTPTPDVDAAVEWYVEVLGAELAWKVRAMGTTVAALRVAGSGPLVLLAGHLRGDTPVLVHRVDDYAATTPDAFRAAGVELHELEIPHGPCAVFVAEGGQRFSVYDSLVPKPRRTSPDGSTRDRRASSRTDSSCSRS